MRDIGLDYPAADADEPITPPEAEGARHTVCRMHNGLIRRGLTLGDRWGQVYFCPVGRMYWRLERHMGGMYAPLNFPKGM